MLILRFMCALKGRRKRKGGGNESTPIEPNTSRTQNDMTEHEEISHTTIKNEKIADTTPGGKFNKLRVQPVFSFFHFEYQI